MNTVRVTASEYKKLQKDWNNPNYKIKVIPKNTCPTCGQAQWVRVKDTPPPAEKTLVAFGSHKFVKAQYVPKHSIEDTDNYQGDPEYCEKDDQYYWPEGWYEWNECEDTHWMLDFEITHYMILESPEGE